MAINPLKAHFRKPTTYVRLPTLGRWYDRNDITTTDDGEVAVYALTALDDILLNTPDAMLNGQALEKVVTNCAPDVKNVKRLMIPDLEAIFVGMKAATNGGKADYDRKCPKCNHENSFELQCQHLLDASTFVNEDELTIRFDDDLLVHVRPYDFEMRQIFIKREFEEEKTLRMIEKTGGEMDEITKANLLGESVDRLSKMTFALVARSIEKVVLIKEGITVEDSDHISEWLTQISKAQAEIVIEAVNRLNQMGVPKVLPVQCQSCGHQWDDTLSFDPTSFFVKRS